MFVDTPGGRTHLGRRSETQARQSGSHRLNPDGARGMQGEALDDEGRGLARRRFGFIGRVARGQALFKYPVRVAVNPMISTEGWLLPVIVSGETITSLRDWNICPCSRAGIRNGNFG